VTFDWRFSNWTFVEGDSYMIYLRRVVGGVGGPIDAYKTEFVAAMARNALPQTTFRWYIYIL
jgi:hypothetical protein